ncbi:MAG TPA: hypothetical protein PLJ60_04225 [Chryseolinea sp.]|nr:hypothetical protein [Chryseolinea sp.]
MRFFYPLFFILSFAAFSTHAQTKPFLEREISISFVNTKLDAALAQLSKQEKFTFSYNPAILNVNTIINTRFERKTLREVLINLVGSSIQPKEKGNYIILTKINALQVNKTGSIVPLIISGYVVNAETNEKIGEVSIYDKKSLTAVITDSYGFFKLVIDKPSAQNFISINKLHFRDTVIAIPADISSFVTIHITPEARSVILLSNESDLKGDSREVEILPPLLSYTQSTPQPKLARDLNMENIRDTLYRKWQVSLFPFVGTNHKLSGNIINDYSFNIVSGYGLGVRKFEVAGYFNINRGNVEHGQLAGAFNLNFGSMNGFQAAGSFNINLRSANAMQVAGAFNFNGESSQGAQFAGVANIQMKEYTGFQVASFANIAHKKITGTQISGFVNYAKNVKGTQIGIINIADSVKGVQLGLLSIVKHGYHKIEVSADEIFYTNVAFRTGVPFLYNIITAGIKPDDFEIPYWTVGYGIGTSPRLSKWLSLDFDVTANQVSKGNFTPAINILNKLYMGFELQPIPKFALAFGVTLNAYVTDTTYDGYTDLFTSYRPKFVYDETSVEDNINVKMWWGAKVGLRFL